MRQRLKYYYKLTFTFLLLVGICFTQSVALCPQATDYSKYSSNPIGWGLSHNKEHKTPGGSIPSSNFKMSKYNAMYVGNTKKKEIYLTFDCGYENGNTKQILDTLKKNKIKAIFFVTKPFIESSPKLVKRMKKEGHLVGNHTCTHPKLGTLSPEQIQKEITGVEKVMKAKTGYTLDKYLRPPEGNYSVKMLKVLKDMGYTTIFWSLAWLDYDTNNQPSVDSVVNQFKTYHHKGMIPLIHNTSTADTAALPQIIKYMKSQKYVFKRIDEAGKKTAKIKLTVKDYEYTGKAPTFIAKTNSNGTIRYTYYNKKHQNIKAPIKPGTYYIKASVKATKKYTAISIEKKFKIKKQQTKQTTEDSFIPTESPGSVRLY